MSASKSKPTVDLEQIVDVIPLTITVRAPDGTIIYANQAVLDDADLTIDDVNEVWLSRSLLIPEMSGRASLQERRDQQLRISTAVLH